MSEQASTNATEARTSLNSKIANPEWSERFLNGGANERREFQELTGRAVNHGDDLVAGVMRGESVALPGAPTNGDVSQMATMADHFRSLGISDQITANFLRGEKVSPDEYQAVVNWRRAKMADPAFCKLYLEGDRESVSRMTIANSVIVNGVKDSA